MASVNHGKFSFDGTNFYAGDHHHCRATHTDLQSLFDTELLDRSHGPEPPVHWYSAQLLHYGLPYSDKKAVAKMRLLEALQDGTLSVPRKLIKLEQDLKREWENQDLEARLRAVRCEEPTATGLKEVDGMESTTTRTIIEGPRLQQPYPSFFPCPVSASIVGLSKHSQKRTATSLGLPQRKKSKIEKLGSPFRPNTNEVRSSMHLNTDNMSSPIPIETLDPTLGANCLPRATGTTLQQTKIPSSPSSYQLPTMVR